MSTGVTFEDRLIVAQDELSKLKTELVDLKAVTEAELKAVAGEIHAYQTEMRRLAEAAFEREAVLEATVLRLSVEQTQRDEELSVLRDFKRYVHERLDREGVPSDPEPAATKIHGCRIEGRINWMINERNSISKLYTDLVKKT